MKQNSKIITAIFCFSAIFSFNAQARWFPLFDFRTAPMADTGIAIDNWEYGSPATLNPASAAYIERFSADVAYGNLEPDEDPIDTDIYNFKIAYVFKGPVFCLNYQTQRYDTWEEKRFKTGYEFKAAYKLLSDKLALGAGLLMWNYEEEGLFYYGSAQSQSRWNIDTGYELTFKGGAVFRINDQFSLAAMYSSESDASEHKNAPAPGENESQEEPAVIFGAIPQEYGIGIAYHAGFLEGLSFFLDYKSYDDATLDKQINDTSYQFEIEGNSIASLGTEYVHHFKTGSRFFARGGLAFNEESELDKYGLGVGISLPGGLYSDLIFQFRDIYTPENDEENGETIETDKSLIALRVGWYIL